MFNAIKEKLFGSNPLTQTEQLKRDLVHFLDQVISNPNEPLHILEKPVADKIKREMVEVATENISSENPIKAFRNSLVNAVGEATKYGTLITTPEYAMYKGITGEMRDHLMDLVKVDKELKEFVYGLESEPQSNEEIASALRPLFDYWNLWMRAFNYLRMLYKDEHPDPTKDWFMPFMISQSIFLEFSYRQTLKLPSNIERDEQDDPDDIWNAGFRKSMIHSEWPRIIMSDAQHPRLVWEELWQETFGGPSPFNQVGFK